MADETLVEPSTEKTVASSRRPTSRPTPTSRRRPTTGPTPTVRPSGPRPPSASTGARSGTRSSTGPTRRSRSGSSAAPSTPPSTASTATSTAGNGDKVAIHWVGEPEDDTRDITYADLLEQVSRAANALTELGVQKGDRVAIYMPMIPEVVVAMLACARLGAPHTVVFGGFSADALASRVIDCGAKVILTADGGYRRGAPSALKPAVDEAVAKVAAKGGDSLVEHVVVVRRTGQDVELGRRARRLVARRRRRRVGRARRGDARLRAPALRHVHLRHDRHARRASCTRPAATSPARPTRTGRSSTSRTTTSTGAPPTSAG